MAEVKTIHPYVTKSTEILNSEPIIRGTRIPVRSVVQYILRGGMTPEEFVKEFQHVELAALYDALSYYYDHKDEINLLIEENKEDKWGN